MESMLGGSNMMQWRDYISSMGENSAVFLPSFLYYLSVLPVLPIGYYFLPVLTYLCESHFHPTSHSSQESESHLLTVTLKKGA